MANYNNDYDNTDDNWSAVSWVMPDKNGLYNVKQHVCRRLYSENLILFHTAPSFIFMELLFYITHEATHIYCSAYFSLKINRTVINHIEIRMTNPCLQCKSNKTLKLVHTKLVCAQEIYQQNASFQIRFISDLEALNYDQPVVFSCLLVLQIQQALSEFCYLLWYKMLLPLELQLPETKTFTDIFFLYLLLWARLGSPDEWLGYIVRLGESHCSTGGFWESSAIMSPPCLKYWF